MVTGAGKCRQGPRARLGIMAFRVAALADGCRRGDIDLAKRAVGDLTGHGAILARGRNSRDDRNMSIARKMRCNLGQPADVLAAVALGKAKVAVQPGAQRVAIEQDRGTASAE